MLPNITDPPLKMLTCTQKIRVAEQMLQDLTLCEQPLDIPGNFRAKQRRTTHDNSKLVFPVPRSKQPENYKTHYSLHFKSKPKARPSSPRPCSPTRRNNPHPSKNFLNWRIPTRVFDYGKEKHANISFVKSNIEDTYQTFYDDYAGSRERKSEVDPKLLLEIAKSYGSSGLKQQKKKKDTVKLAFLYDKSTSELSLPTVLRKSWSPEQSSFGLKPSTRSRQSKEVSPMLMKPGFQPLFQSWYDAATPKHNDARETGLDHDEEKYIKDALSAALKPDAIQAIENWLLEANDEEREIAMQFIQAIILASVESNKSSSETQTEISGQQAGHNDHQRERVSHHHHHRMRKGCEVCQKQELEAALQQLQAVATMPMEVPAITELLNPLHPGVMAEREARKAFGHETRKLNRPRHEQSLFKANKGSLFVTSKKPKGRHFTIHPEWH